MKLTLVAMRGINTQARNHMQGVARLEKLLWQESKIEKRIRLLLRLSAIPIS